MREPAPQRVQRGIRPTSGELSASVKDLLEEVDGILSSNKWAILAIGTERSKHRIYDAASLRHLCRLLSEIDSCATANQEFAVRILGRAHVEAFLFGLYLHFGGYSALQRIANDTQASLEKTHRDLTEFEQWLRAAKRKARRELRNVRNTNEGIKQWNREHPDVPQKSLLEEPHVPQLLQTEIDLSQHVAQRSKHASAEEFTIPTVIAELNELAPQKGFGHESFVPMYHVYRLISSAGPHPTLDLFESYLQSSPGFVRPLDYPGKFTMIPPTRETSLYSTAFLAEWVLGDAGDKTPVAHEVREALEPTSEGGAPWYEGRSESSTLFVGSD